MNIIIDGDHIKTELEFHREFSIALGIEKVYGKNLHALWDVLSSNIERPIVLIWKRSDKSKKVLEADFYKIVDVPRRVEMQDEKFGWIDRFSFFLD